MVFGCVAHRLAGAHDGGDGRVHSGDRHDKPNVPVRCVLTDVCQPAGVSPPASVCGRCVGVTWRGLGTSRRESDSESHSCGDWCRSWVWARSRLLSGSVVAVQLEVADRSCSVEWANPSRETVFHGMLTTCAHVASHWSQLEEPSSPRLHRDPSRRFNVQVPLHLRLRWRAVWNRRHCGRRGRHKSWAFTFIAP